VADGRVEYPPTMMMPAIMVRSMDAVNFLGLKGSPESSHPSDAENNAPMIDAAARIMVDMSFICTTLLRSIGQFGNKSFAEFSARYFKCFAICL